MSMDEKTRVEYAIRFDDIGEVQPLGPRTPRQVKRHIESLRSSVHGGPGQNVSVLARGVVELTGDWIEVPTDEKLHPVIPSWERLGFILGGHERDQRTVQTDDDGDPHTPLIPSGAEPVVPVTPAPTKRLPKAT